MKLLIMCEGPNELEVVKLLLESDRFTFTRDDLVGLVPYHARQIATSTAVKNALSIYQGDFEVLRIGDKLSDELKMPAEYKSRNKGIKKYCTKPEIEMLFIIAEDKVADYTTQVCTNDIFVCFTTLFARNKLYKSIDILVNSNFNFSSVYNNWFILWRI